MKTIVENTTNLSKYIVADDYNINVTAEFIEMGDPSNLDLVIADLNSNNAKVITDVTSPLDDDGNDLWYGCRFTCSEEGVFSEVEGWVDPREAE